MRINGQEIEERVPTPLVLPRGEQAPIVLLGLPILDMVECDKLCPEPTAGQVYTASGMKRDTTNQTYVDSMTLWRRKRWAYVVIKTLEPSNIEWRQVNPGNHETWLSFEEELRPIIGHYGLQRLQEFVEDINSLDPERLEAARQDFFRQQAVALKGTTPNSGRGSTPCGERANDSESSRRE